MKTILKLDLKFLLPIAGLSFMYFNNAKYSVFTLNFWDAAWKLAIWHAETMPTSDHPVPLKYAISLLRDGKIEHWQAICPMDSPLQKSGWNSGMQLNGFFAFLWTIKEKWSSFYFPTWCEYLLICNLSPFITPDFIWEMISAPGLCLPCWFMFQYFSLFSLYN